MNTFATLGVKKPFIQSIKELGINSPSEIQEKAIPILLGSSTDFVGLAQTGTGKTAAFGLPIVQQVDPNSEVVQALILSPTRELVQYTKYYNQKVFVEAVYGGEKIERQIHNLQRTTHVIVATPGRLIDLIERGEVHLKEIKTLVLDEADEMLSMGFKQDLNRILKYTSGHRNTWLFSATMPEEIQRIIKTYMDSNAPRVEINRNATVNANISHQFVKTTIKDKANTIIRFLESRQNSRTKAGTQNLNKLLQEEGFSIGALEGDMQQKERDKVMRAFKNESLQYLISTDVSARGIDVRDLAFVIHHQLPDQLDYYTHRSGRTARAGKKGISIALILSNELQRVHEIEKDLNIKFTETNF
jgi:ATP-dependent RNA helicase DeaD